MTKIEALLRRLLLMRASDGTAKALVFSQYPDALALISKALNVLQVGVEDGVGVSPNWEQLLQQLAQCYQRLTVGKCTGHVT